MVNAVPDHRGTSTTSDCPDANLMNAFIDGRLDEGQQTLITEHLTHCERCYYGFMQSAPAFGADRPMHSILERWRRIAASWF